MSELKINSWVPAADWKFNNITSAVMLSFLNHSIRATKTIYCNSFIIDGANVGSVTLNINEPMLISGISGDIFIILKRHIANNADSNNSDAPISLLSIDKSRLYHSWGEVQLSAFNVFNGNYEIYNGPMPIVVKSTKAP